MKNISGWLLFFALLLCVPVAHADGTAFGTLPSPNGVNNGRAHVSSFHGDDYSAGNTAGQSGRATGTNLGLDNYDETAGVSLQSALQPHSNWVAKGAHARELVVTTPEPSMLLMLTTGLLGVGFFTRRKMGNSPLKHNLV
jgi:hypothetical protein